jgi:glutathione S-transferase
MITIWGRRDSSNVQKVLWCCDELGLQFERIDIGGTFGGNKEKTYLDINPNGLVPTIQDGDFTLWESNSIMRYLVEKYGQGKLLPDSPEGRADANRWLDWQLSVLNPAIVPLFSGLVRTAPDKRNANAIDAALQKSAAAWRLIERHLQDRSYVAGAEFSIGDIPLGVWAYRWFSLPIDRPPLANLHGWYQRLCDRLPYQKHIMIPLT